MEGGGKIGISKEGLSGKRAAENGSETDKMRERGRREGRKIGESLNKETVRLFIIN